MLKYILAFGFVTLGMLLKGQDNHPNIHLADSLYSLGEYVKSSLLYESCFKNDVEEIETDVLYRAAVSFAKVGDASKATYWLNETIDKGYDDDYLSDIRFDLNFYSIRHTQEWKTFMDDRLAQFDLKEITHPGFRQELLEMWQADQNYRRLIFARYNGRPPNEVGSATEAVDRYNAFRLEQIVGEIGWPTQSLVGQDGAHAAWNIVQHAVFNPPLMKRCLEAMKIALSKQEVDGVDYAYLYDRFQVVCALEKQDYGIVRNVPIREEHEVEQRRRQMGFKISLNEYLGGYDKLSIESYQQNEIDLQEKYRTNLEKGKKLFKQGLYEEAIKNYQEVLRCNGYIKVEDIYTAAQIRSILNTRRSRFQAIRNIRNLTARGFADIDRLENDSAFDNIRKEKDYLEIVAIMKKYKN